MAAIDQVVAHFKEKCELKSFEVPEWGLDGKPLEIFVEPFTLKQQEQVRKAQATKGEAETLAFIIGHKAMDADRRKMFFGESMKLLNQADPDVVADVALKIWNLARGMPAEAPPEVDGDEFEDMTVDSIKKN